MRMTRSLGLGALMTTVALGAAVACSSSDENPQNPPSNQADAGTEMDGDTNGEQEGGTADGGSDDFGDGWVKSFAGDIEPQSIAVSMGTGEIVMAGTLAGEVDFGVGKLAPVQSWYRTGFVVKFDENGNALWSKQFAEGESTNRIRVAIDASGAVYVGSTFATPVEIGGETLTSAGKDDIYVAKFSKDGAHLFNKRFGGDSIDTFGDIVVDPAGNFSITGKVGSAVGFGGGELVPTGLNDAFVVQFSPDGQHVFSKQYGEAGVQSGDGLGVSAIGELAVTGVYNGVIPCNGETPQSVGTAEGFLLSLDESGDCKWFQGFDNGGIDVAFSPTNDIIALEWASLNGFSADGSPKWKRLLTGGFVTPVALAVDSSGSSTICGQFSHDLILDGATISSSPESPSIFYLSFDAEGELQNSAFSSGNGNVYCGDITATQDGNALVTAGKFLDGLKFGETELSGQGMYLAKLKRAP